MSKVQQCSHCGQGFDENCKEVGNRVQNKYCREMINGLTCHDGTIDRIPLPTGKYKVYFRLFSNNYPL